ncbi:MAG: hypothetical protein EGR89_00900, partial [[Eubacterium] rectale]|nr:hypothetical protein [Agathobacter rectalis]
VGAVSAVYIDFVSLLHSGVLLIFMNYLFYCTFFIEHMNDCSYVNFIIAPFALLSIHYSLYYDMRGKKYFAPHL